MKVVLMSIGGVATALGAAWLAFIVVCMSGCSTLTREVLYHPDRARVSPAEAGEPRLREEILTRPDGVELVTWRADAPTQDAPTVIYFHGNASDLASRAEFFGTFLDAGFGFAAMSYRSFSGSQGSPSEDANIADALGFVDLLYARGLQPARTVVYGESLGSGVAVQVAANREVAGVVLHAPYDSVEDVAVAKAPWALPRRTLTDRYRSIDFIAGIDAPLLWLHGIEDDVIPIAHGQRLFNAAKEPKTAVTIPEAGHYDLYGDALFARATAPFVRRVTAGGG